MEQGPRIVTALLPLPVFYNPDETGHREAVPEQEFDKTAKEIAIALHEGGTLNDFRRGTPTGYWWDQGVITPDVLVLLEVDMRDTQANRDWLIGYIRDTLLDRFQQEAMYLKLVTGVERLVITKNEIRRDDETR